MCHYVLRKAINSLMRSCADLNDVDKGPTSYYPLGCKTQVCEAIK